VSDRVTLRPWATDNLDPFRIELRHHDIERCARQRTDRLPIVELLPIAARS
jgi:hypothetical protein